MLVNVIDEFAVRLPQQQQQQQSRQNCSKVDEVEEEEEARESGRVLKVVVAVGSRAQTKAQQKTQFSI